ncbi:Abi family protein [Macrococcus equipercicus]|uniref:Abi family protein n=1 Tax=Macrococcus equipercicus TaxID=69967 RepID=A0ABQ6R8K3_9STAP|nr:Abi family protein [Macrococcus equipercicus]KAA1039477.1 Abi family protein [Macrococcus equipercicus]
MRKIAEIKSYLNQSEYSKPYLSCDDQLVLLEDRGLIIQDKVFALEQLKTISYYSLINAYYDIYRSEGDAFYKPGTTFMDFYICYKFDTRLKNTLFKYIILIEQSLKTNLSAVVAKYYGVQQPTEKFRDQHGKEKYDRKDTYLDTKLYDQHKPKRGGILNDVSKTLNLKYNDSINHYLKNHNHVPPWIIILPHNFGQTIKWFSILQKEHREEVTLNMTSLKNYSPGQNEININQLNVNLFNLLREFRNRIAHGQRFYSYRSTEHEARISQSDFNQLLGYPFITDLDYKQGIGKNDLYALFIVVLLFTKSLNIRTNLINELIDIHRGMENESTVNLFQKIGITPQHLEQLKTLNSILEK